MEKVAAIKEIIKIILPYCASHKEAVILAIKLYKIATK